MVRAVEEALELQRAGIGEICMGEVRGKAPDGFDFGNSPLEVSSVDFYGQTIIQRTSAGTQGIVVAASNAERLYAASLVTAEATVPTFCQPHPIRSSSSLWETTASAEPTKTSYVRSISGTAWKVGRVTQTPFVTLSGPVVKSGAFMIRPVRICTRRHVDIALDIDRYDFAMRVEFEEGRPVARMERPT
jgi:2-phosphosulfolactate phosphatase